MPQLIPATQLVQTKFKGLFYYWTSIDVNSSNNWKIIGRLTTRNNGFGTADPQSAKMADSRFETLNEEETAE